MPNRSLVLRLACLASLAPALACSDNTVDAAPGTTIPSVDAAAGDATVVSSDDASNAEDAPAESDASEANDASSDDASIEDAGATDAANGFDGAGATTTIASARQANVTTPITVNAIVTALHGTIPNDVSEWYIEDLAGGPSSGVVVYCDPDKAACPTIRAPSRWTIVQMTGSLSTYQGQVQFVPTAQTVLAMNGASPPIPMVSASDLARAATSTYRGVLVKLAGATTLTVDNVTPTALVDSSCTTRIPSDGGADAGDAGTLSCSHLCSPPAYSGFTANDGKGNEVNIEAQFFATDPLQSSPECRTQPGVTPVNVGMTFSSMEGILDYDGYAKQQQLSPVVSSDYATP